MLRRLAILVILAISGGAAFPEHLRIFTEISPPSQVLGPDGTLSGLGVEVVQEIQKRVGNSDPIQVIPWPRAYREAQSDQGVLLFSMARTGERNHLFQWVGPILETTYSLFVKASSNLAIRNLEDAKKLRRIGVYRDDARDLFLTQAGFENLDRITDNQANVKKLMANRLDAFASARDGVAEFVVSAGYKSGDVREALPFMKVQLYLAFSLKTPEGTVKAWSEALEAMKKDGTFEKLFRKYLPNHPLPGPAITRF